MDLVPEESREEVFAKQVATVKDIAGAYLNPTPSSTPRPKPDLNPSTALNLKPEA